MPSLMEGQEVPHREDEARQDADDVTATSPLQELCRQFTLAANHRDLLAEMLHSYEKVVQEWDVFLRDLKKKSDRKFTMDFGADDNNSQAAKDEQELNFLTEDAGEPSCDFEAKESAVKDVEMLRDDLNPILSRYAIWSTEREKAPGVHHAVSRKSPHANEEADYSFTAAASQEEEKLQAQGRGECKILDSFVLHPTGLKRIIWDALSLVIVIYDIIALPLMAFGYDSTPVGEVMRIITMVFWTFDIVMSFFSGFQKDDGYLEMRCCKIGAKYMRSRFPIDFTISSVDWILFFGQHGNLAAIARIGKSARLSRAMRLFRVMRMARIKSMVNDAEGHIASATAFSFLHILRLMIAVMTVNHFFACGWYGVATLEDDGSGSLEGTWAEVLANEPMTERYIAAYRWSLAQFTPSSVEYLPATAIERLYALFILVIGLVIFSAFLGNVTAIVNDARTKAYSAMVSGQNLRCFISDNQISLVLARAITNFFKEVRGRKRRVLETDLPMIQHLPRHLREELHYELHAPRLQYHSLFAFIFTHHRSSGLNLCHSAAFEVNLIKGDEPFYYQRKGENMLFPISGSLDYFAGPGSARLLIAQPVKLGPGEWTTEAPLWMEWEHRGLLSVGSDCVVLLLDSYKFRKASANHDHAIGQFKEYAKLYAQAMAEAMRKEIVVDDVWGTPSGKTLELLTEPGELEKALTARESPKEHTI